jgi:hypothetical protein
MRELNSPPLRPSIKKVAWRKLGSRALGGSHACALKKAQNFRSLIPFILIHPVNYKISIQKSIIIYFTWK